MPTELPRGGLVRRAIAGCLLVLAAAIATSVVFFSGELSTLRHDVSANPSLPVTPGSLAPTGFGGPQTLLLVGDDTRKVFKYYRGFVPDLANEMLLVRLDPNKPWISMMSIPRELWVTIYPPHGRPFTNRLNSAYTFGIGTLVSTIKRVIGVSINHVVVITFDRFQRAVDQMGCVYSTVDRRYYHLNVPGGEQYQEINLYPGYQNMCGVASREFVSYRHGDTSLVRDARDQSFLLDVKKQYGASLADNVHRFEQIFGQAVQTDPALHTTSGILDLLGTLIASSGRRVRQVHFQANLLPSYDTASPGQIAASVHAFLFGGSALPRNGVARVAQSVRNRKAAVAKLPLVPVSGDDLASARAAAASVPFPVEYPRVKDRAGAGTPVYIRNYLIHKPDGTPVPIYVHVFSGGQLGQFYDVQGTTWTGAPQFASPDQTLPVGGRTYDLYYEAEKLKLVAWQERGAVYWIRNTLNDTLSNGEMLAIAEQTEPVSLRGGRPLHLGPVAAPNRPAKVLTTSEWETIGSVGGLLALLLSPLLAFVLLRRHGEVRALRSLLGANLDTEARLTAFAEAAGAPRYVPAIAAPAGGFAAGGPGGPARGRVGPPRRVGRPAGRGWRDGSRRAPSLPVIAGGLVVATFVAGALAWALLSGSGSRTVAGRTGTTALPGRPVPPTVPVRILNAGSVTGAAGRMAAQLRADGVRVSGTGDVSESRAAGLWVLYTPGQQLQAARLAGLLAARIPRIAPIDPAAQAASGGAPLVLVIQ